MKQNRKVLCRGFVELVTAYLEDAVEEGERERIDRHLDTCRDCARVIEQWRVTIDLVGHLGEHEVEALPLATRDRLFLAFRERPAGPD